MIWQAVRGPRIYRDRRQRQTDTSLQQLRSRLDGCPTESVQTQADGKKFTVVRHFAGDKELGKVIAEIARERADRETGPQ